MAINRRVLLNWDGSEYDVKITMGLIDKIEQKLNLMKMVVRVSSDEMRYSEASTLIAILLNDAGCEVEPDDVFDGMFNGEGIAPADVVAMLIDIFSVIFPAPKKKLEAPSKKPQTSTRGKTSSS